MFAREGDPNSPIKIIDFGVATLHKPGDPPLNAFAGSMRTVAPEVIKRSYDNQCDMWSVGVVTFFLLTQQMPFNGGTNQEIFQKICSGQFFFPRWTEQGLSEEAKDFIDDLLVLDPRERMTSREALAHPWIRGQMTKSRSWKGSVEGEAYLTRTVGLKNSTERVELVKIFSKDVVRLHVSVRTHP